MKSILICIFINIIVILSQFLKYSISIDIKDDETGKVLLTLNDDAIEVFENDPTIKENINKINALVDDPFFTRQWYFFPYSRNKNLPTPFLDIIPIWYKKQNAGQGVQVLIIGYPINMMNMDLNVEDDISAYIDNPVSVMQNECLGNSNKEEDLNRSTRSAEIIAMKGNNDYLGIGAAPLAKLASFALLKPTQNINLEYIFSAINHATLYADVSLIEWDVIQGSMPETQLTRKLEKALEKSVKQGRNNRGTIHVIGTISRPDDDDSPRHCGRNALMNSMYTIGVTSSHADRSLNPHMEACPAIMVTVYGPDDKGAYMNFVSPIIESNPDEDMNMSIHYTGSNKNYGGSLVTAILAMVIRENPKLGWREIQYLLYLTSSREQLQHKNNPENTWIKNAAQVHVSGYFGFGMISPLKLVSRAKDFNKPLRPMRTCVFNLLNDNSHNPPTSNVLVFKSSTSDECKIDFIEHVQLEVTMKYPYRDEVDIEIKSPGGTMSMVHKHGNYYKHSVGGKHDTGGMIDWKFDTIFMWGESAANTWKVFITNHKIISTQRTEITLLKLYINGTMPDEPVDEEYVKDYYFPIDWPN